MKDDRDPTVNLKNINFINVAERYKRKVRSDTIFSKASVPKFVENDGKIGNSQEEAAKEYYKTALTSCGSVMILFWTLFPINTAGC